MGGVDQRETEVLVRVRVRGSEGEDGGARSSVLPHLHLVCRLGERWPVVIHVQHPHHQLWVQRWCYTGCGISYLPLSLQCTTPQHSLKMVKS